MLGTVTNRVDSSIWRARPSSSRPNRSSCTMATVFWPKSVMESARSPGGPNTCPHDENSASEVVSTSPSTLISSWPTLTTGNKTSTCPATIRCRVSTALPKTYSSCQPSARAMCSRSSTPKPSGAPLAPRKIIGLASCSATRNRSGISAEDSPRAKPGSRHATTSHKPSTNALRTSRDIRCRQGRAGVHTTGLASSATLPPQTLAPSSTNVSQSLLFKLLKYSWVKRAYR